MEEILFSIRPSASDGSCLIDRKSTDRRTSSPFLFHEMSVIASDGSVKIKIEKKIHYLTKSFSFFLSSIQVKQHTSFFLQSEKILEKDVILKLKNK